MCSLWTLNPEESIGSLGLILSMKESLELPSALGYLRTECQHPRPFDDHETKRSLCEKGKTFRVTKVEEVLWV